MPDHATIARFRGEHEDVFAALFTQVLQVAAAAGLVRFGTVAIEGTKIAANASIDANRGQEWLDEQGRQTLAEAQGLDAPEDAASARGSNDGDAERLPPRLRDRRHRAERIRQVAHEVIELARRREHSEAEENPPHATVTQTRMVISVGSDQPLGSVITKQCARRAECGRCAFS